MSTVSAEAVSERFKAEIAASHRLGLSIEVLDGSTGDILTEITSAISGTVTLDASAAIRGRCELELAAELDLVPAGASDPLAPFGNELKVSRGVLYSDGTSELVELGVFKIRRVEPGSGTEGGTIKITGLDRWSRFADARFEETREIAAGTNVVTAITELAQDAWPSVTLDLGSTAIATPLIPIVEGDDRGALMQKLATDLGQELYFSGAGVLTLRPIANASTTPLWTLEDVLTDASKVWDTERVYNRVVATGEALDDVPPVRGVATDENPLSPTYYFGPFGRRPRFYVSSFITTDAQALDAAEGILAGALGTSQQISLGAVVNPAIAPGQAVRIVNKGLRLDELHVLDAVTIPLTASETMTASTRIVESVAE